MNIWCLFFLIFLLRDRRLFFNFFDCLSGERLLFLSVLLSLEDLLQLLAHFLLGCSFRGSPVLSESPLLVLPLSLLDLIREWLFYQLLEPLSLPDVMLVLYLKTEEVFIYWLNYTVIFIIVNVIVDFKLQIELRRSAPDSNKNCKRGRDSGLQSDVDWVRGTQYSIIWGFVN